MENLTYQRVSFLWLYFCYGKIFFKIEVGGVVLLDDYGQPAYIDTKIAIDNWVSNHNDSLLLHLPTTQALIIKNQLKSIHDLK